MSIRSDHKYGPFAEPYLFCLDSYAWQWRLNGRGQAFLDEYLANYPVPARLAKKASVSRSAYKTAVRCGLDFDEINSVCHQAIIRATMKFEPARNIRFSSYASWWMRSMLTTAITDQMKPAKNGIVLLTDVAVNDGNKSKNNIVDTIPDKPSANGTHFDRLWLKDRVNEILRKHLRTDFRVRVYQMRYGLDGADPMTNDDIARQFNLSGEKIRNIVNEITRLIEDDLENIKEHWHGCGVD